MKKNKVLGLFLIFVFIFTLTIPILNILATDQEVVEISIDDKINMINESVERSMADGRIPGVSLVIVRGGEVIYSNGFGYADIRNGNTVTVDTVFELGSNSKAFTGLGILKLEYEGLVDLNAPVTQYIPWLEMYYDGEKAIVTVAQVMNHTSGIPFRSIDRIPESISDDALEETVRTLVGTELQTEPGTYFSYATINYNILGLIIEIKAGQPYETFMIENVLQPIGLGNTHMFREDVGDEMANGYKISFLRPREFEAPIYRGSTPTGYILSSGYDISLWMVTQLGFNNESTFDQGLIARSHQFGSPLWQGSHLSYTAGWFVNGLTGVISHGGSNPNFSSYVILDTENDIGIAVLANLNSPFTEEIAMNVNDIIHGIEPRSFEISDMNLGIDRIAVVIICISILVVGLIMFLIIRLIKQIQKKQRTFAIPNLKAISRMIMFFVFLVIIALIVYQLPRMFFDGISWQTASVWAPETLMLAVVFTGIAIISICLYLITDFLFKKKDSIPIFFTILVSVVAGLGNALIVFMINETLRGEVGLQFNLLLFFILGIIFYAGGSRIARAKLIKVTNYMIYKLRIDLINKILNTPLENVEKLDDGVIQATLNNDTEMVATFPDLIVNTITASTTMLACFIYLGFINILTLLICIITIIVIAGIYFVAVQSSDKLMEEARTTQNVFFKYISDMTKGFKELRLNIKRRQAFESDIDDLSDTYNKKMRKAFLSFADAFVVGELVFTLAIGFVVFIFPIIFGNLRPVDLRSYVFILLFLTGPVNGILNTIPSLAQIRVAWGRVNKLLDEISEFSEKEISNKKDYSATVINLTLKDVEYEYTLENSENFKVGPISCHFNSGEVTFITGGNGSGKSTLAKMITGLYRIKNGEILLNNQPITASELEQKYATVFGDFHLFDKLYGIDYEEKKKEFEKYMEIMQLSDKTKLEDGAFSTTELSTGQRKRLALIISYLEDRPIYLFDEWAADQDPEFREFFYKELLPDLRERGKCVIAITHDDRYFDCADHVIKMEWGQMVEG